MEGQKYYLAIARSSETHFINQFLWSNIFAHHLMTQQNNEQQQLIVENSTLHNFEKTFDTVEIKTNMLYS